ncbi:MAG TPA: radical SAM protein [Candidatus Thermoplasmatota archaeon]|nr:radical SAM protein [Candidatus Thermoplasmatota archaeon]
MAHPLGGPDLVQVPTGERYAGSKHLGVLPLGCVQCREGAKLVLFGTGLCDKECFYCPVSRDKMYRDVMFANERPIHAGKWEDLIDECELIGAKGAGITGGDPMVVPDRVVEVIKVMKAKFGPEFHTHLYTSCAFDLAWVAKLKEAGLDEIRFHPDARDYANMAKSWHHPAIAEALRVGLTTTIEIPCIPGKADDILAMAAYLEAAGAHGLNMNELEFSDPNIASLKRFGYQSADDESQRVAGSRETAALVLDGWKARRAPGSKSPFAVHFCSSPYKDAIQLMQRFRRRASRTARPFEEQTEEGTLVYGVLAPTAPAEVGAIAERLRAEFEVPMEWVAVVGDRIETAPWVAEELADEEGLLADLGCAAWLSEVHPTADRLEVERTPLPFRDGADAA